MFGFGEPKMETPKLLPSFEELKAALPEELQEEWVRLGEALKTIERQKGSGAEGTLDEEASNLSEDDERIFARHAELQAMALENLKK